jgi:hypothetical protein
MRPNPCSWQEGCSHPGLPAAWAAAGKWEPALSVQRDSHRAFSVEHRHGTPSVRQRCHQPAHVLPCSSRRTAWGELARVSVFRRLCARAAMRSGKQLGIVCRARLVLCIPLCRQPAAEQLGCSKAGSSGQVALCQSGYEGRHLPSGLEYCQLQWLAGMEDSRRPFALGFYHSQRASCRRAYDA